jgi:hypothetical protein
VYPGKNTPGTACIDQSLALLNVPFRPKSAFRERQLSAKSCRPPMSAFGQKRTLMDDRFRPIAAGGDWKNPAKSSRQALTKYLLKYYLPSVFLT